MKKHILLFGFLLFSTLSYSQVSYGLKFGLNYNRNAQLKNKSNEIPLIYQERFGYEIGFFLSLKLSNKISIKSGLSLSEKGMYLGNAPLYKNKNLHLTYGILPLLFVYDISKNFKIQTGFEFGYLFSSKIFFRSGFLDDDFFDNNIDLGLNLGIRYALLKKARIGLNFSYSLIPIYKNWTGHFPDGSKDYFKVKSLNRTLGLVFNYIIK